MQPKVNGKEQTKPKQKAATSSYENQGKNKTLTLTLWLIGILLVCVGAYFKSSGSQGKAFWIVAGSLTLSPLLIVLLTIAFGRINYKNGIWDYIVGEEGTYSLSRVQGVLWALIIIAFQLETLFGLITKKPSYSIYYEPVLSESTIWLLGLTLTSYLAVKGITVNNIAKKPGLYKRRDNPSWSDLLTGPNGLDFSRCQMLLWTVIAVVVYISKCYNYTEFLIREANPGNIPALLTHMQIEYKPGQGADKFPDLPFVPFLPWSFIVLMGLSQGVYVGKKLVPTFKLDDVKDMKATELKSSVEQLAIKRKLLTSLQQRTRANNAMPGDKENLQHLETAINDLENNIAALNKDLKDINTFQSN